MARPLRLEYEGAVYHLTSRGNERSTIFRDDLDRTKFLGFLGAVVSGARWKLHAYCLMGNHYHLLIETPLGNLARGMQRLNGRYTQWFNFHHDRSGHLLQGRYKAILVEKEEHLLELCRYVVLNPVRAGMVDDASRWSWSNYRATAGVSAPPDWLDVRWTLSRFSPKRSRAREAYRRFVAEGKGARSPMKDVRGQIYLGGDAFLKEMEMRLEGRAPRGEIPARQRRPFIVDIGKIKRAVAKEFGRTTAELSRKRGGEDKATAIFLARDLTGLSGAEIGSEFGVSAAQVGNVTRSVREGKWRPLNKRIEKLRRELEPRP